MQGSKLRRNSTQKAIQGMAVKKVKRIKHIKSLPAYGQYSSRKSIFNKNQTHLNLDENQAKSKRFKTHQNLKTAHFGAVKTARERTLELGRKKQHISQQNKSLTKSTTFRSPPDANNKTTPGKSLKSKKCAKKTYTNIFTRVKQVMQEYQLKLDRYRQQKQQILKENHRLKSQLQFMSKRKKKIDV